MQTTAITLILGLILLFVGRRVYWLFVGGVGFLVGINLATRWLAPDSQWMILIAAIVLGLLGAILAIFFQRLAVGIAGFFGGGHFALMLLENLGYSVSDQATTVIFIIAGIVAAILAIALFDWALIILSALIGAALIAEAAVQGPALRGLVFVVLFVIGFAVQASMLRRRSV